MCNFMWSGPQKQSRRIKGKNDMWGGGMPQSELQTIKDSYYTHHTHSMPLRALGQDQTSSPQKDLWKASLLYSISKSWGLYSTPLQTELAYMQKRAKAMGSIFIHLGSTRQQTAKTNSLSRQHHNLVLFSSGYYFPQHQRQCLQTKGDRPSDSHLASRRCSSWERAAHSLRVPLQEPSSGC